MDAPSSLTIPVPPTEDLGPAMRALNDRQRMFVVAYFHLGKRELAAFKAGYAGEIGSDKLGVSAHTVWHNPKVQSAIREFGEQCMITGLVPLAFAALEDALTLGGSKEKLKAAQLVMDRTGFHAKSEIINAKPSQSREDQIKEIMRLCKLQGLDARKLIGGAVDFVDADFEVMDKETAVKRTVAKAIALEVVSSEVSSTEGLEDLL